MANNQIILHKDDYTLLLNYVTRGGTRSSLDRANEENLQEELKKAKLVSKDEFPADVVRINSSVKVKADDTQKVMEIMIVTPDKANIKEKKVSVMAPIGTALLGFRQGEKVMWQVPAGKKTFTIVEVNNV